MKDKDKKIDINQIRTSLSVFRKSYNENIPADFPRASFAALRKFKIVHPSLFRKSNEWSVDAHRKKLMDWLLSYSAS